jgi:hypothetical protein
LGGKVNNPKKESPHLLANLVEDWMSGKSGYADWMPTCATPIIYRYRLSSLLGVVITGIHP